MVGAVARFLELEQDPQKLIEVIQLLFNTIRYNPKQSSLYGDGYAPLCTAIFRSARFLPEISHLVSVSK